MNGLIVSSFNAGNLVAALNNDSTDPKVSTVAAPFGQVSTVLLDATHAAWAEPLDFLVVWTQPHAACPAFRRLIEGEHVDRDHLFADVDIYAATVLQAAPRTRLVFVAIWDVPPIDLGRGVNELRHDVGTSRLLMEMNLRLMTHFDGHPSIVMLNTQKWATMAGEAAFNARLWYLGKIPFGNRLFQVAAAELKAALRAYGGRARKLVVVDLDDTLWGGTLGEVGWEHVVLGGHDPEGEALVDFQRALRALARRGIVLAIASKNDESVALHAIDSHPEMILRSADFAGWRINWGDKAGNIADLTRRLNLPLDAVVFIDDNPLERSRVREALPDVLVPEWPQDKRLYPSALLAMNCFETAGVTTEDRTRTAMYSAERRRDALKTESASLDQWLHALQTRVAVASLDAANSGRVAQLLNKTNQFNLRTRRCTEVELTDWASAPGHVLLACRVRDRFGDSGIVGIASVSLAGSEAHIEDFVLSCRVMGRGVEEAMLHALSESARRRGAARLVATHAPTPKNAPCLEFFRRSGLCEVSRGCFIWSLDDSYPLPRHVELLDQTTIAPEAAATSV